MNDPIATLRGLLAESPSVEGCVALHKLLSRWPDDGSLAVALTYANQHLGSHEESTHPPASSTSQVGPDGRYLRLAKLPVGALSWLGLGDFSEDHLGWDQERQARCIIRTFPQPYDVLPGLAQLVAQTEQTSRIEHPHVLSLYDSHFHDQPNYAIMAHVTGPNVRQVLPKLRREGTPEERRCVPLAIGLQVLDGLHAAHTHTDQHDLPKPLLHTHLRPKCVQLSETGVSTIANFGLWRVIGKASRHAFAPDTLTPYDSPEQLRDKCPPSPQSDLFQVGILLYELFISQHPFQGKTELHSVRKLYDGQHKPPQQAVPDLPDAIAALLTQALAHVPENRFESATAMRAALLACYQAETDKAPETHIAAFVQRCFAKESLLTRYACLLSLSHESTLPFYWSPDSAMHEKSINLDSPEHTTSPQMNALSPRGSHGQPVGITSLLSGVWRILRGQS